MNRKKSICTIALAIAFGCSVSTTLAESPKGDKGKGKTDRNGEARGDRDRSAARPTEIASKMVSEHDANSDTQLQAAELAMALTAQRERRAQQAEPRGGKPGTQGGKRRAQGGKPGAGGQKGAGGGKRGVRGGQDADGQPGARQRGAGQRQRGAQRDGQRGGMQGKPAARGGDSSAIATQMIAKFDSDQSQGLDVTELTEAIEAQRSGRGGRPNGDGQGPRAGQRRGQGKAGGDQPKEAGQRKGRGARGPQNEDPDVGTGVSPKRPN